MKKNNSIKDVAMSILIATIMTALLISGCSENTENIDEPTPEPISYEGKKILYIHSYHEGSRPGIVEGITEAIAGTGIELKIHYMDTKRNPDEEFKTQAGLDAQVIIEEWNPDVVITCDDNAFKYLVMPYYRDTNLPFVHCGINWDASVYGAPYRNTTGIIEVALVEQLVDELMNYSNGERVGYLSMEGTTGRKAGEYFSRVLETPSVRYVSTFSEWKEAFVDMQETLDLLVIGSFGSVTDFDENEAMKFVRENIRIPIGANHNPEMPYATIGFIANAKEPGEWVGQTALRILNGTNPSDIPEAANKQATIVVNLDLAEMLDITFPASILKIAEIYEPDENQ